MSCSVGDSILRSKVLNPGNALANATSNIKGKFHDFPKKLWNALTPGCPPACRYNVSGGRRRRRRRGRRRRRRHQTKRRKKRKRQRTRRKRRKRRRKRRKYIFFSHNNSNAAFTQKNPQIRTIHKRA